MARKSETKKASGGSNSGQQLRSLKSENDRLVEENRRLRGLLQKNIKSESKLKPRFFRSLGILFFIGAAGALLLVGNLFFWAGNTVVKTDRYAETVQPLIHDPQIQDAVALYTTEQLFNNVDVEALTEEVLPPRAEFLAPSISSQIQSNTKNIFTKIIQSNEFQERWNKTHIQAHQEFIAGVGTYGSDGSIDISEFYTQLSQQLQDTRLAFLAGKSLPPKVGAITLVEGAWLSNLERLINNIDLWRTLALALLVLFSFLAVWLSRNKRRTVILLGAVFALTMFLTLVAIRLGIEVAAGRVDSKYHDAAHQAAQIIMNPLISQTRAGLLASMLVILVAWVSGPSRSAGRAKALIEDIFAGRVHQALFSGGENKLTLWVGKHQKLLQWLAVGIIAASLLFMRLTIRSLLISALLMLVVVFIVDVLAAKKSQAAIRPR